MRGINKMNKFNEARAKNIEDLKKVVKDIEDGKIKFFQMVAFPTDDEGFAKSLRVIGTMSPYAARGVNESLAEKAREQIQSIPDTNSNGISLSDLLGMFGESGKE